MRTGRSAHRATAEQWEVRGRPRPHSASLQGSLRARTPACRLSTFSRFVEKDEQTIRIFVVGDVDHAVVEVVAVARNGIQGGACDNDRVMLADQELAPSPSFSTADYARHPPILPDTVFRGPRAGPWVDFGALTQG